MKGIEFRTLRVNMFGEADAAIRTLNTAIYLIRVLKDMIADDEKIEMSEDCIANLKELVSRIKENQKQ